MGTGDPNRSAAMLKLPLYIHVAFPTTGMHNCSSMIFVIFKSLDFLMIFQSYSIAMSTIKLTSFANSFVDLAIGAS